MYRNDGSDHNKVKSQVLHNNDIIIFCNILLHIMGYNDGCNRLVLKLNETCCYMVSRNFVIIATYIYIHPNADVHMYSKMLIYCMQMVM